MTKMNSDQLALVDEVGRKWVKHKANVSGLEARIRERVRAELSETLDKSALEVAEAMQLALDGGATKVSIRRATSKNPGTVESFLRLLEKAPEASSETEVDLQIAWEGDGVLRIELDPLSIPSTEVDRENGSLWVGAYEVFVRPADGKVFIDPTPSVQLEHGVTEWLRADSANEALVGQWVTDNPAQ